MAQVFSLDVRSESEAEDEARRARASLVAIPGVGDVTAEMLYQGGFKSAEELAAADEETVGEIDGIGPERAGWILTAARAHVEQKRAEALAATAAEALAATTAEEPAGGGEGAVAPEPGAVSEEGRE